MARPYYWWFGSDLKEMFAEITAKGLDNVRLEFHPDDEMFYVRNLGTTPESHENGNGGHDFTHVCPPDCP